MMKTKRPEPYITYTQLQNFLKERSFESLQQALNAANGYFLGHKLYTSYSCPFPTELDIITISDEEFLEYCDNLPIWLFNSKHSGTIRFNSIVPAGYDCYIIRHVNSIPATDYDHDFFEICYVWKGSCIQHINQQHIQMHPGDFLIVPPETKHAIQTEDDHSVIFLLPVKPKAFQNSYGTFLSQQNVLCTFLRNCLLKEPCQAFLKIHSCHDLYLKRIIKHFTHECYIEQAIFCDFVSGILNQLFSYMILYGEVESNLLGLPDDLTLLSLLRDIQEHYTTITLKELAKKYHFSEAFLSRMIRKMTGKPFTVLLHDIRIEQACSLLTNTDYSLKMISEIVGYQEYSSFYRLFYKEMGMTPAAFRENQSDQKF